MVTNQAKEQIRLLTSSQVEISGSQNKYAAKIGVSSAVLTNLNQGKYDTISDEMWRKLAAGCGYRESGWQIVETANYKRIIALCNDAKTFGEVYALVASAGSSKTVAITQYSQTYTGVALVKCEEHWNKKEFLTKILQSFGKETDGLKTGELLDAIEKAALDTVNPLIILDELDKVRDELLYFFISLYNRLQHKCGVFICCTDYLKKRVIKGKKLGKKGYAEFFSRIGGKFIDGSTPTANDIVMICKANGITNQNLIDSILIESDNDLRRVERLVNAKKRKQAQLDTQEVQTGHREAA